MKYFLLLLILMSSVIKGNCCTCAEIDSTITEYNFSDLVVFGEVVSISIVTPLQTIDTNRFEASNFRKKYTNSDATDIINFPTILAVKLKVLKGYKGAIRSQIITIFTPRNGASCGYRYFSEGKKYIVFGRTKSFILSSFTNYDTFNQIDLPHCYWTSNCNRTTEEADGNLTELDAIKAIKTSKKR